jgi:hypothetical protein
MSVDFNEIVAERGTGVFFLLERKAWVRIREKYWVGEGIAEGQYDCEVKRYEKGDEDKVLVGWDIEAGEIECTGGQRQVEKEK